MTKDDFAKGYNDLIEHFGQNNFSKKRAALLFDLVKELPRSWWTDTVHRMICANDGRYDIAGAARSELRATASVQRTKETNEAWDNLQKNISESGLSEALGTFGANSLWEAVKKAN